MSFETLREEREAAQERRDQQILDGMARKLLREHPVEVPNLSDLTSTVADVFPGSSSERRQLVVNRAVEIQNDELRDKEVWEQGRKREDPELQASKTSEKKDGPVGTGQTPDPYQTALDALREDPDTEMRGVLNDLIDQDAWEGTSFAFARGPWRRAKMKERKERTGSAWKPETVAALEDDEDDDEEAGETAPSPSPPPEEAGDPEEVTQEAGGTILTSVETTSGHFTMREEPDGLRVIYHERGLSRQEAERLITIIAGGLVGRYFNGREKA